MLHIHKTYVQGVPCHYLVQSYNLNGKPRQRVLFRLGEYSTIEEALEYWRAEEVSATSQASKEHASDVVRKLSHYAASDPDEGPPP